ncbi:MAG: hypothetical protein HY331_14645 [Chloroflexi bacterium]|nr:hypothetical protein [Chloroflexota bacterium]
MTNAEHEHDHEHAFVEIARTENIVAYEETVHQVITLRLHDRGLALELTHAEARELADALAQISARIGAQTEK